MKKLMIASAIAAGLACSSAVADSMKVGVIDFMKVYSKAPQGEKTLESLKKELKPKVSKLQSKQKNLVSDMETLKKNKPTMTKEQYESKKTDLEKKGKHFQKEVQQLRQKERQREQHLAQKFKQSLKKAVSDVGKQNNYDLIMTSQAAPYASGKLDVTDKVLKEMKENSQQ